ncbi:MAG: EamA family transporter [Bacteroidota bacterium]
MWIVFALLAALTAAIVVVLSKAGLEKVDPNLGLAIQSVMILIVAWTATLLSGKINTIHTIEKKAWIYLIVAGILSAVSALLTFRALKMGNASMVAPLERVSLIFAIALAAIFLKERITWQIIVGAVLMAGGAIIIALQSKSQS